MSLVDGILRVLSGPTRASLEHSIAKGGAADIDRIVEDAISRLERFLKTYAG